MTRPKRRRRDRTVSISLERRGQTTQDFAVGIGIFLLSIAFVFSYLPTLLTPFSSDVGSADAAQADRIAATAVANLSDDPDRPNHLDGTAFNDSYAGASAPKRASILGLRSIEETAVDRVNVTIHPVGNETPIEIDGVAATAGEPYDGNRTAAGAARIVTVDGADDDTPCEPACRLVVRVW